MPIDFCSWCSVHAVNKKLASGRLRVLILFLNSFGYKCIKLPVFNHLNLFIKQIQIVQCVFVHITDCQLKTEIGFSREMLKMKKSSPFISPSLSFLLFPLLFWLKACAVDADICLCYCYMHTRKAFVFKFQMLL